MPSSQHTSKCRMSAYSAAGSARRRMLPSARTCRCATFTPSMASRVRLARSRPPRVQAASALICAGARKHATKWSPRKQQRRRAARSGLPSSNVPIPKAKTRRPARLAGTHPRLAIVTLRGRADGDMSSPPCARRRARLAAFGRVEPHRVGSALHEARARGVAANARASPRRARPLPRPRPRSATKTPKTGAGTDKIREDLMRRGPRWADNLPDPNSLNWLRKTQSARGTCAAASACSRAGTARSSTGCLTAARTAAPRACPARPPRARSRSGGFQTRKADDGSGAWRRAAVGGVASMLAHGPPWRRSGRGRRTRRGGAGGGG